MGDIVNGHYDGSNDSVTEIMASLDSYSEIIDGWAWRVAEMFVRDIDRQNAKEWRKSCSDIGTEIRNIVENTPTGHAIRSLVEEQVRYIKSLPLEAADRIYDIHNRAIEAVVSGGRAKPFADEIAASGDVAKSRAALIARTETGRASTALTQIRALSLGSEGYIWRTADDGDVRHSHDLMNGKFVRWDSPPVLDGMTGHAGALPNCRCYCEVIFPRVPFAMKREA